jgi:polygalacturonase
MEALRPQLVYISYCNDVTVQDVRTINSAFWTNHLYRCDRVKYLDCYIESPTTGTTKAPSSDGIDLDDCDDVLVRGCYINICDDGVCLKGGRGTWVDRDSTAGPVNRVIVEKCRFGHWTNAGVTFGSDAFDCRNIIMRDCQFENSSHMVLFKMRTDTPQRYEDVLVERCSGCAKNAIEISSWKQFHTLDERLDMPTSIVRNVTIRDMDIRADKFFFVNREHPFTITDFTLQNIKAEDKKNTFNINGIENLTVKDVILNGVKQDDRTK